MKNLQRLTSIAVTALLSALISNISSANPKIYANGEWLDAQNSRQLNIWENNSLFNKKTPSMMQSLTKDFLHINAQALGINEKITLSQTKEIAGEEFSTIRLQKNLLGLEVVGGETLIQIANNEVALVNTDNTNFDAIDIIPHLSSQEAESIAFAAYQGDALAIDQTKLKVLISPDEQGENISHLVYEITVRDIDTLSSDIHYIDAHRGNEILVTTNVHTIKNRKILAATGDESDFDLDEKSYKLVYADAGCKTKASMLITAPTQAICSKVTKAVQKSADFAFKNSGIVYDYYKSEHKRDSIDGRGMLIQSVVNFGKKFSNAAWVDDKSLMIYGMGDGKTLNDFATALDVAGHELTHGITARTAKLQYVSESGALNESYSDIFGKLIDIKHGKGSSDWKIGKDLFKGNKGKAIRDMENPEIGHVKDFKYRGETCSRNNDFCGVHSNSGIHNRAAVMIIKKLGAAKATKLFYLTLTQLLRSNSNFKEARAQTEVACAKLFNKKGAECIAVTDAFSAVGI